MGDLPTILAVVSGKGGVGKTMLAMAIATELSKFKRVLLVDLDFFNRGLTALLNTSEAFTSIPPPSFLESNESVHSNWQICRMLPSLFFIPCPETSRREMGMFSTLEVEALQASFRSFILAAAQASQCDCVVIDCHGGPDNSSFAACLLADHALLVSEPDKITFGGTLHFKRQLEKLPGYQDCDLRLVFNKIVPAFSSIFLRLIYNRSISTEFAGKPLLAMYPLELYLTKEFEKTPFLTSVFPNSLLARKTQVLLLDLFDNKNDTLVPEIAKHTWRGERRWIRYSLGKIPFLFDTDAVLPAIAIVFLGTFLLQMWFSWAFRERYSDLTLTLNQLEHALIYDKDTSWLDDKKDKEAANRRGFFLGLRPNDDNVERLVALAKYFRDYPVAWDEDMLKARSEFLRGVKFNISDEAIAKRASDLQAKLNRYTPREVRDLEIASSFLEPERAFSLYGYTGLFCFFWFLVAVYFKWGITLERWFLYHLRQRRWLRAGFFALTEWFAWALLLAGVLTVAKDRSENANAIDIIVATYVIYFMLTQFPKGWRVWRYEGRPAEGASRVLFVSSLMLVAYMIAGERYESYFL